jgi:cytoskeletal protein CcmA (bactofilin family)
MFSRKKPETEDRKMSDLPDDLGIPMKPARPAGQSPNVAPLGRTPTPVPPRAPDPPRSAADGPKPAEAQRAPSAPVATPIGGQRPAAAAADSRKLIVGREITLSGDIKSCDQLLVEGSVEANLQNSRQMDIAESGLFKGSASIEEAEVRGRFEGNLTVRKRLMIYATGKVSGTIRYGQIEIECGGQISGDIQAHNGSEDLLSDVPGARAAS